MANIKPILYGVGAFGLVYGAGMLYRQFSLIKNSEYNVKNVKFRGIDLQGAHLTANMEMKNNSDITINVYGGSYDIFVNGQFIGKITDRTPVTIPAKGSGTFSFNIDISPKQAVSAGANILAGGKAAMLSAEIQIKGKIKAKTSGILFSNLPLDIKFKVGDFLK